MELHDLSFDGSVHPCSIERTISANLDVFNQKQKVKDMRVDQISMSLDPEKRMSVAKGNFHERLQMVVCDLQTQPVVASTEQGFSERHQDAMIKLGDQANVALHMIRT